MIIFLDIDGVLHPLFPRKDRPGKESAPFAYLPRLSAILRDYPDTHVVISSTWRVNRTLKELKALFPLDLQDRIIGSTPVLEDSQRPGGREEEASSWLDLHPEYSSWIAVDDCAVCWFSLSKLILCDDGFREVEEAELRSAIERHSSKFLK
ncbi:HAD domain-containing protein [Pseudomonas sp. 13B_3.2_Bac1]|uniref:HAD domain-containing protein n=1 Tax=Pseudomonas sp. 13B_3.2_Bac1 TaxID=2971623 RepID=UPI0021CA63BF|nr:HAD domain-containing protein [Pseudomonas sp. 13B_3.2_Bac1]MCU1775210.1 HAD domain-containing protein [Pseudomonas sp. 13B_3.2_Bac1]